MKITYLPLEAKSQPGDQIVTSGLGGIFPKGILIGTIREVEKEQSGMVLSALIEPRVNFNRLEEVLIILDREKARLRHPNPAIQETEGEGEPLS